MLNWNLKKYVCIHLRSHNIRYCDSISDVLVFCKLIYIIFIKYYHEEQSFFITPVMILISNNFRD